MSNNLDSWRDEVVYIAQATSPVARYHTPERPFCPDWACPCHSDCEAINAVTDYLMAGLISWFEANLILRGATI